MYLDEKLLHIARAYQKRYVLEMLHYADEFGRHEPHAPTHTLRTFLDLWHPCLEVVTSTPIDIPSTAALHDTYLLRLTSEMTDGIRGYTCRMDAALDHDTQLMYVLYWMELLDLLWAARLSRAFIQLQDARALAEASFPTPAHAHRVAAVLGTSTSLVTSRTGELALQSQPHIPALCQTDCVRLRDEILHAKEQLFGWMRDQLGVPRPPTIDDTWPEIEKQQPRVEQIDTGQEDSLLNDMDQKEIGLNKSTEKAFDQVYGTARTAEDDDHGDMLNEEYLTDLGHKHTDDTQKAPFDEDTCFQTSEIDLTHSRSGDTAKDPQDNSKADSVTDVSVQESDNHYKRLFETKVR